MKNAIIRTLATGWALAAGLLVGGCATQPVYPPGWATSPALPQAVAATPERFVGARVIWGGKIVAVTNKSAQTEVEILAYPLDDSQKPVPNDVGAGRFIAVLPGYVEPMSYPTDGWVTVQGQVKGVRSAHVGAAPYVFPLVAAEAAHVWSADAMQPRSKVNFSVGVGIGIH